MKAFPSGFWIADLQTPEQIGLGVIFILACLAVFLARVAIRKKALEKSFNRVVSVAALLAPIVVVGAFWHSETANKIGGAALALLEDEQAPKVSLVKATIEVWAPDNQPYLTAYIQNQSKSSVVLTAFNAVAGSSIIPRSNPQFANLENLRIPPGEIMELPVAKLSELVERNGGATVLTKIVAAGVVPYVPSAYCPYGQRVVVNGRCVEEPIGSGRSLAYGLSLHARSVLGARLDALTAFWLYEKTS